MSLRLPAIALCALCLLQPLAASAQSASGIVELVTPAEAIAYQGALGYAQESEVRMRGAAPGIDVLAPQPAADLKLKAPFAIDVRFQPLADAAIVPGSFRVLYGALKLDITSRVARFVQPTPTGFTLDKVQIPAGRHKVVLQVQDERQRLAEKELRFEVE